MKIAITGASGFIGSYLKQCFEGHTVVEVDLEHCSLDSFNFHGYDTIIHLAGIAHRPKGADDDLYFRVNRDLAFNTAKKAKNEGVGHFVFMSTVKVYCDSPSNNEVLNEQSPCNPADVYGRSKFEAENLIRSIADANFAVAIIRSTMVYGAGVKANMLNLIGLVDKLSVLPFKGIKNGRSMVYIGNLAYIIKCVVLQRQGGTFIPTDKSSVSTFEMTQQIAKSLGKNRIFVKLPKFVLSIFRLVMPYAYSRLLGSFVVDNSMTMSRIKCCDLPFSTDEGIKKTVEWYLSSKK